jgi:D-alanyl-D-alanine carboxypeptidase (penicillin-binding protein 5/6)
VLTRSRLAAGSRRVLLALLLLLFAAVSPAAPILSPHPAQASSGVPRRLLPQAPPTTDHFLESASEPTPPLRRLFQPIYFQDATSAFHDAPVIVGSSGILVDLDRNLILWEGHAHERRAPASTTKMMTAFVALDNFPLDQVITVTPAAAARDSVETRLGLLPNEKLTVRELLTGMLMVSANDAADAIAGGTVGMDAYVEAMNRQVSALGLRDTHFTNPVGFPDEPGEVSSAYDLAAIATAGYRDFSLFRDVTATHDAVLTANGLHQEYKLHNINRLLDIYPAAIGTKSGFTDDAGPCLVSMATRDGHHLVAVIMNAQKMFDQTRALMEWGFSQEGLPPMYPTPSPAPPKG